MNVISQNKQKFSSWIEWQKNQKEISPAEKSTEEINKNLKQDKTSDKLELTEQEKKEVTSLKMRDQSVRNHERAHLQAAGKWASSGASYSFKRGPDNKLYAVAGEVNIDISEERTPEETIEKMKVVKRAALAPADPSPQDKRVAAKAAAIEFRARMEKSQETAKKLSEKDESANKYNETEKNNEVEDKNKNNKLYDDYLNMVFSGLNIDKKA